MNGRSRVWRMMILGLALVLAGATGASQVVGQGGDPAHITANMGYAFTYQGRLVDSGGPITGSCDLSFGLYDAAGSGTPPSGGTHLGTVNHTGVPLEDGLFTVLLDFGPGVFNGQARWLEIGVDCGSGPVTLSPRQPLTPAPYALALPGLWTEQTVESPNLIGGTHDNDVSPGVVGATIGGGGRSSDPNRVTDIYGTIGGGSNNQAGNGNADLTDGQHATVAGGLGNMASGYRAAIGGGALNQATNYDTTVGGGYNNIASHLASTIGGGTTNIASGFASTVGGGYGNTASGLFATVGGGGRTTITDPLTGNRATDDYSTVGGGTYNQAGNGNVDTTDAVYTTVAGGYRNHATSNHATVGGGYVNYATNLDATIGGGIYNAASGESATIGGGSNNSAAGIGGTVPGGALNAATGDWSLAAGRRAKALHSGAFVWADSTTGDFESTLANQVRLRATNGLDLWANNGSYGMRIDHNDTATNGDGLRVYANVSNGASWAGVRVTNLGTSPALYANTNGTYSGYFYDNIYVSGSCVGCDLVYVARNDGDEPLEPGDLVAVGGLDAPFDGSTTPLMRVQRAGSDGAAGAIGVVQGRAILTESDNEGERAVSAERAEGRAARGDLVFVVVQGIAQVKVDVSAGTITPGQRLTISERPGHVRALQTRTVEGMVVVEGAPVVGIALAPPDAETGLLPVLVTLQ